MDSLGSRCKIVVVGDTQCGKTALLHVFAKDCYPEVRLFKKNLIIVLFYCIYKQPDQEFMHECGALALKYIIGQLQHLFSRFHLLTDRHVKTRREKELMEREQ